MKGLITSLFLILMLRPTAHAQADPFLWGKWNIVSVFDGEVYISAKTDSVFMTPDFKKGLAPKDRPGYAAMLRKFYFGDHYEFTKDGIFKHFQKEEILEEGKYTVDKINKRITVPLKDELFGKIDTLTIKYSSVGNKHRFIFISKHHTFDYVLEKRGP